uniref:Uncharacterized protein n=1 Tax=Manihot esculenta TaxID=3983 RepID=A0A2C9UYH3_MANES
MELNLKSHTDSEALILKCSLKGTCAMTEKYHFNLQNTYLVLNI